jgi:hypothetical protein
MSAALPVAKFDLCRELYELSGWGWTNCYYRIFEGKLVAVEMVLGLPKKGVHLPAYDVGYLVEKLPQKVNGARLVLAGMPMSDRWGCAYLYGLNISFDASQIADTPQDAACGLAIVLWRQGILTKRQ